MKKSLLFSLFIVFFSTISAAQLVSDERAMYDRMDRLERDITLLQRKIYKSSETGNFQANEDVQVFQPGTLNHLYVKMNTLEQVQASLTGQLEELSHEIDLLKEEQKKINIDMDLRFAEQEKNRTSEIKKSDNESKKEEITTQSITRQVDKKQTEDIKQIYDAAYKLVSEQKYAEAQIALEDFLAKYPKDTLAGNAQYWLGETFYVRELYELAAVAFAKGVKEYKDSSKGADCLFKLGMTMEKLNKKKEACTAFKNVKKEFPKAADALLSKTQKEIEKLGCDK